MAMLEIPLANGRGIALIDDEDAELVLRYRWHLNSKGYALRAVYRPGRRLTTESMHRLLMGCVVGDGRQVDHINGDKIDNRRENLRICTSRENGWNAAYRMRGQSQFVGVCYKERGVNSWMAYVASSERTLHLGVFSSEIAAALARDAWVRQHRGEFGTYNFPREGERSALGSPRPVTADVAA